jgi:hypothetical protein
VEDLCLTVLIVNLGMVVVHKVWFKCDYSLAYCVYYLLLGLFNIITLLLKGLPQRADQPLRPLVFCQEILSRGYKVF